MILYVALSRGLLKALGDIRFALKSSGRSRKKRFVVEPEIPVAFHAVLDSQTIEQVGVH